MVPKVTSDGRIIIGTGSEQGLKTGRCSHERGVTCSVLTEFIWGGCLWDLSREGV